MEALTQSVVWVLLRPERWSDIVRDGDLEICVGGIVPGRKTYTQTLHLQLSLCVPPLKKCPSCIRSSAATQNLSSEHPSLGHFDNALNSAHPRPPNGWHPIDYVRIHHVSSGV